MKQIMINSIVAKHNAMPSHMHVVHSNTAEHQYVMHITKLAIPTHGGLRLIAYRDILYVQADGNYSTIHTIKGHRYVTSKTLKHFTGRLRQVGFVRSHQSYLVNTEHIEFVHSADTHKIELSDGSAIPFSRRLGIEIKNYLLNQYSI